MFLWTYRNNFDKPAQNFSSETRKPFRIDKFLSNKVFAQTVLLEKLEWSMTALQIMFLPKSKKIYEKKGFFQKKILPFSHNVPLRKVNCNFDKPAENVSTEARTSLWTHNLFQKSFLQRCSLENEKRSFYKLDAIFSPEARRNFVNLQFFSMKSFFLKCSSGNVESDFDNIAENFLPNVENVSELTFFFQTESFGLKCSSGKKNARLPNLLKIFFPKREEKLWTYSFSQTIVFFINVPLKI